MQNTFVYNNTAFLDKIILNKRQHQQNFIRCSVFQNLSKDSIVEDITGKQLPLVTVLSHTVKYLTDHCLGVLRTRIPDVTFADVLFVLTVPAIWPDQAKRLMRGAAKKVTVNFFFRLICLFARYEYISVMQSLDLFLQCCSSQFLYVYLFDPLMLLFIKRLKVCLFSYVL